MTVVTEMVNLVPPSYRERMGAASLLQLEEEAAWGGAEVEDWDADEEVDFDAAEEEASIMLQLDDTRRSRRCGDAS